MGAYIIHIASGLCVLEQCKYHLTWGGHGSLVAISDLWSPSCPSTGLLDQCIKWWWNLWRWWGLFLVALCLARFLVNTLKSFNINFHKSRCPRARDKIFLAPPIWLRFWSKMNRHSLWLLATPLSWLSQAYRANMTDVYQCQLLILWGRIPLFT